MRKSNFEADTNMTDMVCDFLIGIAVVILSYLFFGRSGEFSRFFCYGFATPAKISSRTPSAVTWLALALEFKRIR